MTELLAHVRRLVDRLAPRPARRVDWEGVYRDRRDVPEHGSGFASEAWLAATRRLTIHARDTDDLTSETQILATVVSMFPDSRPVRVLDFGGGMGVGFFRLRRALGSDVPFSYDIVEGAPVCEEGQRIIEDHRVRFHTAIPGDAFDVIYAASSLQYIDGLDAFLFSLVRSRPRYALFADVPAGDRPSFWTGQLTVPGSRIAYHFLNLDEVVAIMARLGYTLLVRGLAERPLHVECLPPSHRITRTCNLLFGSP